MTLFQFFLALTVLRGLSWAADSAVLLDTALISPNIFGSPCLGSSTQLEVTLGTPIPGVSPSNASLYRPVNAVIYSDDDVQLLSREVDLVSPFDVFSLELTTSDCGQLSNIANQKAYLRIECPYFNQTFVSHRNQSITVLSSMPSLTSVAPTELNTPGGTLTLSGSDIMVGSSPTVQFVDSVGDIIAGSSVTRVSSSEMTVIFPTQEKLDIFTIQVQLFEGHSYLTSLSISVVPCPNGTFSSDYRDACEPCAMGYFANSTGLESCFPCPLNTYANETGLVDCYDCPISLVTNATAQISNDSCICANGTYYSNSTCLECPDGAVCEQGATNYLPSPGFWQLNTTSNVSQCVPAVACPGLATNSCTIGYSGSVCVSCDTDLLYQRIDGFCIECPSTPYLSPAVLLLSTALITSIMVCVISDSSATYQIHSKSRSSGMVLLCSLRSRTSLRSSASSTSVHSMAGPLPFLHLILTLLQLLGALSAFDISNGLSKIFTYLSTLTFGANNAFNITCLVSQFDDDSYRLVFTGFIPFIVYISCLLGALLSAILSKLPAVSSLGSVSKLLTTGSTVAMHAFFPLASFSVFLTAFRLLDCDGTVITTFPSLECGTENQAAMILICIGTFFVLFPLISSCGSDSMPLQQLYRTTWPIWYLLDAFRSLVFAISIAFFRESLSLSLTILLSVIFIHIFLYLAVRPIADPLFATAVYLVDGSLIVVFGFLVSWLANSDSTASNFWLGSIVVASVVALFLLVQCCRRSCAVASSISSASPPRHPMVDTVAPTKVNLVSSAAPTASDVTIDSLSDEESTIQQPASTSTRKPRHPGGSQRPYHQERRLSTIALTLLHKAKEALNEDESRPKVKRTITRGPSGFHPAMADVVDQVSVSQRSKDSKRAPSTSKHTKTTTTTTTRSMMIPDPDMVSISEEDGSTLHISKTVDCSSEDGSLSFDSAAEADSPTSTGFGELRHDDSNFGPTAASSSLLIDLESGDEFDFSPAGSTTSSIYSEHVTRAPFRTHSSISNHSSSIISRVLDGPPVKRLPAIGYSPSDHRFK